MKKKNQKIENKKALAKVQDLYKEQNEKRAVISQMAKDYKQPLNMIIREYFKNNYIKVISYKECYECDNKSLNYRVFVKSDKKLPKGFTNSQLENDIKTMILINDKSKHIKCCIGQEPQENYQAF